MEAGGGNGGRKIFLEDGGRGCAQVESKREIINSERILPARAVFMWIRYTDARIKV